MTHGLESMAKFDATLTAAAGGFDVWDRLWKHRPGPDKDASLLAREQGGERWSLVVDRLESTFGTITGLKTIELGSGRGDLSALLAKLGARVTLLDASDKALEQAGRRFDRLGQDAAYQQADLLGPLHAWRNRFDVALSLGVIEHFKGKDRTRAVYTHLRVLRPGGVAIISVPHAWCVPYRVWKSYLELRGWWPYGMELPYARSELVRRAREAGFSRTEVYCFGFWQSISSHWARSIIGWDVDWSPRKSRLDRFLGSTLLLFAWRGGKVMSGPDAGLREGGE